MNLFRSITVVAISTALLITAVQQLSAQTRLPAIIGSNMVLQRNAPIPIWGWAAPGQRVRVEFAGQSVVATAGVDSLWQIRLLPLKTSDIGRTMTFSSGRQQTKLHNILVGEVWLCSGQSNMEYPIDKTEYKYANPAKGIDISEAELKKAHPGIRVIKIETKFNFRDATTRGWQEGEGKTFARTSAVAFFFAKQLQAKLGVPIGVITSAWNGSRIEPWTHRDAYKDIPAFTEDIKQNDSVLDNELAGKMYKSMIAPLVPFTIKGVIWYQGESNCLIEEHDMRYAYKMRAMIAYWRKQWNTNLPFYYVLLAPFNYTEWKNNIPHTAESLPKFWEQQVAAAQIPKTDFIVTTDLVDNFKDIHPPYKWIVGNRLANVALSKTYSQTGMAHSYAQYKRKKVSGDKLILYFKNAKGFRTSDGKSPDFFEIAGADGRYLPGDAVIKNNTVVVSNPKINRPTEARFGWTEEATPNLINADGLPTVPFRTNGEKWKFKE
ncbi:MAG: sialate O-acetylesterase [Sphingobacteriales bacterium]|nr:MAG: sialate O-acetylesterase [Sphingobacteriales bacterium]